MSSVPRLQVHIPEDAITMWGSRAMTWTGCGLSSSATPRAIFPTGGASCIAAVEPADGPMDVDQPQPSTPNEPPQVPSPHLSGSAGGSMDVEVEQPLPPIHEEPLPVSGGQPEELSAAHPSPSSLPPRPTDGRWTSGNRCRLSRRALASVRPGPSFWKTGRLVSSAPQGPLMGGRTWSNRYRLSPKRRHWAMHLNDIPVPLTASGYELMKGDVPHWQSGPELSTMSSADHRLMGGTCAADPGPSTESEHEMMDVLPSSPVSPTNRVGCEFDPRGGLVVLFCGFCIDATAPNNFAEEGTDETEVLKGPTIKLGVADTQAVGARYVPVATMSKNLLVVASSEPFRHVVQPTLNSSIQHNENIMLYTQKLSNEKRAKAYGFAVTEPLPWFQSFCHNRSK
ncbi:hypothetical protein BGY98DRAFT_935052 [Russula aff. rugulosa BPL654]|nr:hypothetical protein BGY98DRAFT_935052 [Russula aff. rugulosa BPL654]